MMTGGRAALGRETAAKNTLSFIERVGAGVNHTCKLAQSMQRRVNNRERRREYYEAVNEFHC